MNLYNNYKINLDNSKFINEDAFELWKNQMDNKSNVELMKNYRNIVVKLNKYNNTSLNHKDYIMLLDKLEYLEDKLNIKSDLGLELK